MKKVLILCAAMALFASSAFAAGADLTTVACPGVAGSSSDVGTIDCAGGQVLVLLATFQPAEAISDLTGINAIFDIGITGGDVTTNSTFWDFQNANSGALGGLQTRPSSGCTPYTNAWSPSGSGFASGALVRSPSIVRIAALCYRPSNLAVTANQKVFGMQITIDGSTSLEAGGTVTGCGMPASMVLNEIDPGSSTIQTTPLTTGSSATNCTVANGGNNCAGVPTSRHTWGQLKSLYR